VPFLLLVGQVAAADLRRDAFQEIDYSRMFGASPNGPPRSATLPARRGVAAGAESRAVGLAGPVVVALAEDVLTRRPSDAGGPQALPRAAPYPHDIDRLRDWLPPRKNPW